MAQVVPDAQLLARIDRSLPEPRRANVRLVLAAQEAEERLQVG